MTDHVIVHGPGIETLPPPPPGGGGGIFGDNAFWIAQCVSFQYLLVCKMNYSAFRDYLRYSLIACIKMGVSPTNPKQQAAKPFFVHSEILHMLVSMGITVLAAAVILPRYGGLNYACGINED